MTQCNVWNIAATDEYPRLLFIIQQVTTWQICSLIVSKITIWKVNTKLFCWPSTCTWLQKPLGKSTFLTITVWVLIENQNKANALNRVFSWLPTDISYSVLCCSSWNSLTERYQCTIMEEEPSYNQINKCYLIIVTI